MTLKDGTTVDLIIGDDAATASLYRVTGPTGWALGDFANASDLNDFLDAYLAAEPVS